MMKMKKMIALVLCAALLVCTLAACGGKNDNGVKFTAAALWKTAPIPILTPD